MKLFHIIYTYVVIVSFSESFFMRNNFFYSFQILGIPPTRTSYTNTNHTMMTIPFLFVIQIFQHTLCRSEDMLVGNYGTATDSKIVSIIPWISMNKPSIVNPLVEHKSLPRIMVVIINSLTIVNPISASRVVIC